MNKTYVIISAEDVKLGDVNSKGENSPTSRLISLIERFTEGAYCQVLGSSILTFL